MIKYLGSKRSMIPLIQDIILHDPSVKSVADVFSGTARVGHALKMAGLQVFSNDHNAYGATIAKAYVEADYEDVAKDVQTLIKEFQALPGKAGYFTETFCVKSRFFQPKNGERIDAIRESLEAKSLDPILKSVLLVSLMEAADRVDSTCGVQMAYLKKWADRSANDLELRAPNVLQSVNGKCKSTQLDAFEAMQQNPVDVTYLDPPYNQHSYLGNYHIWESLVLWDKPEVYGIACKRIDVRERKSDFNFKHRAKTALQNVIDAAHCRTLVVSFSNEGYITRDEMEEMLGQRGPVYVIATDFKRYIGAQIGIYNKRGEVVGKVGPTRNLEYLYIVPILHNAIDWQKFVLSKTT